MKLAGGVLFAFIAVIKLAGIVFCRYCCCERAGGVFFCSIKFVCGVCSVVNG
jgi:hypothetical protein